MQRTVRTFVAIEISSEVRARAQKLITQLQGVDAKVRWVDPAQLHLTLKFLGEIDLLEVPQDLRGGRRSRGQAAAVFGPGKHRRGIPGFETTKDGVAGRGG